MMGRCRVRQVLGFDEDDYDNIASFAVGVMAGGTRSAPVAD